MREGEALHPSCVISGAELRELWRNLDASRITPSPSPVVLPPAVDPVIGVTTDHDSGVW